MEKISELNKVVSSRVPQGIRAIAVAACLIFFGHAHAALTASIDRVTVHEGESLELTISDADGEPETAPIQRNFDILSRAKSSQVNIVNGRMRSRTEWVFTLMPKHAGTLEIPAIRVGGARTSPLRVHVTAAPASTPGKNAVGDVFIETEVKPQTVYPQQQAIFTIRLWRAVEITDGSLSEPRADKLDIQRLGDDAKYTASRGNTRYHVIERRYAVFPQTAGHMTIAPIELTGKTVEQRNSGFWRNDPFGSFFSQPLVRPIHLRSHEQRLNVLPIPAQADASNWLPATRLTISENWSPQAASLHIGDPITRTLIIHAIGQQAANLPEIGLDIPDVKLYPDQPKLENSNDGAGINGQREQKFALVATREGPLNIPPLRIDWWDTTLNKMQTATLPGRSFNVVASPGGTSSAPLTKPEGNIESTPSAAQSDIEGTVDIAWRNTAIAFALLWLATALTWIWRAQRARATRKKIGNATPEFPLGNVLRNEVIESARKQDTVATRGALLRWARARWPDAPLNLPALARRIGDTRFTEQATALDNALYAQQPGAWDSNSFIAAFEGIDTQDSRSQPLESPLPALYPHKLD